MGEEQGLFGSAAYVQKHADEMENVVAMINVDMPGAPRTFGVFGHPEFEQFMTDLVGELPGYELNARMADPTGPWSDHHSFQQAGVCTLALRGELGDGVKCYHTVEDKYNVVDRRATVQSAAVLGVLLRRLADTPIRPTRYTPIPQKTQNQE